MNHVAKFIIYALLCITLPTIPCYGQELILNADAILASSGRSIDYKKLDNHEIVTISQADIEKLDSHLALTMLLYLKAPTPEVIKELQAGSNQLSAYPSAFAVEIKNTQAVAPFFSKLTFNNQETKEIKRLFAFEGGKDFNLSKAEQIELQRVVRTSEASHDDHAVQATKASLFFQQLLIQRLNSYLLNGLTAAYRRDDKQVSVEKKISTATANMTLLQKWFPDFYANLRNFPDKLSAQYTHHYFLIKDGMEGRPVFILKHQMSDVRNDFALIVERQFYISHGLDTVQVGILCMPYKEGTLIGLGSQSFTHKVAGMGQYIAHKIGRNEMAKQIRPMFEQLQQKFSH